MKGTKLCDRNLERGDGSKVSLLHEDAAVKGNLCPDGTVFVCVDCATRYEARRADIGCARCGVRFRHAGILATGDLTVVDVETLCAECVVIDIAAQAAAAVQRLPHQVATLRLTQEFGP